MSCLRQRFGRKASCLECYSPVSFLMMILCLAFPSTILRVSVVSSPLSVSCHLVLTRGVGCP